MKKLNIFLVVINFVGLIFAGSGTYTVKVKLYDDWYVTKENYKANETLFNIYFVSNGEETLLRAFRLSDLKPTALDQRQGGARHLLLASRRSRDGYFHIGLGDRKPVEFTVLHASSAMQPLAKVS